ncbi:LuxR C-terminal-related transcriptional regulator [Flavivirga abyssicola]|uniref:LuxR C-terminal-related transcriptional regulator n=1 Tax=Flavivirga abyssicola TaxID=3063533 RepID=UPI0026E09B59|nr:LuxR C-terminal-related transcriptional regulator [Flavivirga sp. MEBiC07777]WVK14619.1 LuxR C-terminal-related transcriptional regulator [Flavivirga sp. MEBiC07777]
MTNENTKKLLQLWDQENKMTTPNNKEPIIEIIDQIASLFTAGSFYYYILDFASYKMTYVHEGIEEVLGIKPEDWSIDTFFELTHPDEIENVLEKEAVIIKFKLDDIRKENISNYKTSYLMKLRHANGKYKTILHQTKVINVSDDGMIQTSIGIHTDVTYLNPPVSNKFSFISRKKPNIHFEKQGDVYLPTEDISNLFTKREKEIIALILKGKTAKEIGGILHISNHTVNTHKRNMLKKSKCKNSRELVSKCLQEGIV